MPSTFQDRRRIEFYETDMAGIVHFSNYFRFMESTEHAFFRSLGLSIHMEENARSVGWPRVHASCNYLLPLRFEDEVEVELRVREKKRTSLTYDFVFRKVGGEPGGEVARGSITAVSVAMDPQSGRMRAVTIPDVVSSRIEAAPSGTDGSE